MPSSRCVKPRKLALSVWQSRDVDVGLCVLHGHAKSADGVRDGVGAKRQRRDEEHEAKGLNSGAQCDHLALRARELRVGA